MTDVASHIFAARRTRPAVVSPVQGVRAGDIDTLRALACIALVSFHVVGSTSGAGMELPLDHPLHQINASFADMRMPLFSFLSGWVFVVLIPRGDVTGWAVARIQSKLCRLLVPMITVGTLFWLMRDAMGVVQQPLWSIPVLPFAHFWYLQATFLMMALFIALIWVSGGRMIGAAALLMVAGFAAWLVLPPPAIDVFSVGGAIRLAGFFAAGFLAVQYWPQVDAVLTRAQQRGLGCVVFALALAAGVSLAQGLWVPGAGAILPVKLGVGLASCLALVLIRPQVMWLARLGHYSFAVYLFHVFFTAGTREGLLALSPGLPTWQVWAVALIAGLVGPVAVQWVITRRAGLRLLVLGIRARRITP